MSTQLVQGYGITKYMNIMNIYNMCVSVSRINSIVFDVEMLLCIILSCLWCNYSPGYSLVHNIDVMYRILCFGQCKGCEQN